MNPKKIIPIALLVFLIAACTPKDNNSTVISSTSTILSATTDGSSGGTSTTSTDITSTTSTDTTSTTTTSTTSSTGPIIFVPETLLDVAITGTAASGWTYSNIGAYSDTSAKIAAANASITSPNFGNHGALKVTLTIAVNGGNSTTTTGALKFGVEGLNSSQTVVASDYITNSTGIPAKYNTVEFSLEGENICYVRIIYVKKLSGVNVGLNHVKIVTSQGQIIEDNIYKVDSFDRNIQDLSYNDAPLPSIGSPKALVIPIDFADNVGTSTQINELKKTFYGDDTEWESLKSYYHKSSYGKLDLDITVLDTWYTASQLSSYYNADGDETEQMDRQQALIDEVFTALDPTVDFSPYDTNGDEFIDAVYFIYNHPYDYEKVWWAWQYYYFDEEGYFDDVSPYYYIWASYDFIKEDSAVWDNVTYEYNAHTYIHETGHLFGLDDYYDYAPGEGPENGLGYADMMDGTIGDHNPFSKMLLGWATPTVVTTNTSVQVELKPFQDNGDFILLSNNWNGTLFDEYFLLEYYTPTGLHEEDKMYRVPGIRAFHVSAEVGYDDWGYEWFVNDNSYSDYKVLSIIEADGGVDSEVFDDNDLFVSGDVITAKYNSGNALRYKITVNSLSAEKAVLTISI